MNKSYKKRVLFICALLTISLNLFSVDSELVTRYMNAANEQYSAGNYAKAFSYINIVLSSYKNEALPQNVEVLSELVYYGYLERIKDTRDIVSFNNVKEKLIEYPFVSSDRIGRIIRIINTYEAQDLAWGSDPTRASGSAADVSSNNPVVRNTLELQLALDTIRREAAAEAEERTAKVGDEHQNELLETQKAAYESAFEQAKEMSGSNSRLLILALLVLGAVMFVVFVIVIINLVVNMKSVKNQNDKFVETLNAVSELARAPSGPTVQRVALPPVYGSESEMRYIGSAMKETGLPPPPATETEKQELSELAKKSLDIGAEIDLVTGRKNNSKNVAEIVFKIAQEMGVAQYESTLFFSVAMVYDIGFLEIDKELLQSDNLTDSQKYEIRNHVKQGLAQLSFVPEKYMSVFADGVLMHHENMDGSGYPEGLQGSRIPYIARLIRIAESFNALISRRSYRAIFDKESAVAELRKTKGLYDPEIIDVLERII